MAWVVKIVLFVALMPTLRFALRDDLLENDCTRDLLAHLGVMASIAFISLSAVATPAFVPGAVFIGIGAIVFDNCCHEKVPFGKVEAINGNIRAMLRRGRG